LNAKTKSIKIEGKKTVRQENKRSKQDKIDLKKSRYVQFKSLGSKMIINR